MPNHFPKSVLKADGVKTNKPYLCRAGFWMLLSAALLTAGAIISCKSAPPAEPAASEDLFIREVSEVPGYSKQALFEGAKLWLATSFSSELDVIQYANRDQGALIGKTSFPYSRPSRWGQADRFDFRFTVMVETKDDKIRTTFSDMALVGFHGIEGLRKADMEVIRPRLRAAVEALVASFHQEASSQDEW